MNASIGNEDPDLRYAEYALGLLDATERAAMTEEMRRSSEVAEAVEQWQRRLAPLAESIAEVPPPEQLWVRIQAAVAREVPPAVQPRERSGRERPRAGAGWWDSLRWWRGLAFAAGAAAVVLLLILVVPRPAKVPPTLPYLTATLQQNNGATGWTVTVDLRGARAILVPVSPQSLPAGRAPELWLIPPGGRPEAVGMISPDSSRTLPLPAALLSQLTGAGTFAVSVEPPGGSPTGQPTGAVIAQGPVRRG